ncbi:hypothetical protein SRABI106_03155 [Rahnella aquatilis]|nr:hypothetical protein SRABI106_03155 [Rahnella aquatilis]
MDHLGEGACHGVQADAFHHDVTETTEERVTFAEGQTVAVEDPQHADQSKGDNNLSQHGQNVFRTQ